jgi:4-hydroxyacetophenone monooxygenase
MDFQFDHLFAPREENERYVNWLADHFGLRKSLRLNTEVVSLRWMEVSSLWEARIRNAAVDTEFLDLHMPSGFSPT